MFGAALAAVVLAVMEVLPADRMGMADRLFNKGRFAEARAEYEALKGAKGLAPDEILFRLAECDRATGKNEAARAKYSTLAEKYPDSPHAGKCRFMYAMGFEGEERRVQLAALDTDRVDRETRAAALYHLAVEKSDADLYAKCVAVDPKGKYVNYANLRRASILSASGNAADRRKGIELLLVIAFGGKDELAAEALYLAAVRSYREGRYGESGSLFRRYGKTYPGDSRSEDARAMSVWSDYMAGRYSDAAAACGEAKTDDLAYVKAACAYQLGENEKALKLFKKYLEDFPKGRYRADAELPIARIEFDAARKGGDGSRTVESAKRGYALSKLAADELRLAWAYEKAGRADAAADEYRAVAKNFPGCEEAAEALYRCAMIDVRAEKWSAAEMSLAEACATGKLGKRLGEALYWRGMASFQLGHETEGVARLEEALKAGLGLDESREARLMIADAAYRAGKIDTAKDTYEKLVKEGACERMSAARILAVGKTLEGDSAAICAKALVAGDSAEWRQSGWALLGRVEERRSNFTAAIDAYRKCLAEKAETEELAAASLALGRLETRAGEHGRADATLKKAVTYNASSPRARAEAYLALAENAEAKGDAETACAYATIVTSLFDDAEICARAKKIVAAHPEKAQ